MATQQKTLTSNFAPLIVSAMFGLFLLVPSVVDNQNLMGTFVGTLALLVAASIFMLFRARSGARGLVLDVSLRPQHYLQALAHTSIFVYWAFYWDPLRQAAPLIAAQIAFAYAFDMLLSWERRGSYTLGFGPFPIVYSTNLFLRFRDDWFYWQFAMIAVGFLAKEFIKWHRDGKRCHIFNPSSFTLALFSLGLILTHSTNITWGEDIANKLNLPPHIYLFIFAVSLPGHYLFRITTMTLSAVLTTYAFSMLFLKMTGTYFFWDSNIPIAVFLGMNLLFTDPSTSPRTELGRIIFGFLYGASVVALYAGLGAIGVPTFYDKLLQVPIMNLMVPGIDAAAKSWLAWLSPENIGKRLAPARRSLVYTTLWVLAFGALSYTKGVGDFHEGHTIPFWAKACDAGRAGACEKEGALLNGHCADQSGWACNELALLITSKKLNAAADPGDLFIKACGWGQPVACDNSKEWSSQTMAAAPVLKHGEADLLDFPRVLRQGKGPIPEKTPLQVYARACDEGWMSGCAGLAGIYFRGSADIVADKARAAELAVRACEGGVARSCSNVGLMYKNGDGVAKDPEAALRFLKKSCDLGFADACKWLVAEQGK